MSLCFSLRISENRGGSTGKKTSEPDNVQILYLSRNAVKIITFLNCTSALKTTACILKQIFRYAAARAAGLSISEKSSEIFYFVI